MVLKKSLNTNIIYSAVYEMAKRANIILPKNVYEKLCACNHKNKAEIQKNAYIAMKNQRPLCQDTGQVIVFLDVGNEISFDGEFIYDAINNAVEDSYKDNFFRKSVVNDAIFDRNNTKTNTPVIIHTHYIKGDEVRILLGIKGGGAENMTRLFMLNPTIGIKDINAIIMKVIEESGENACPPISLGIGSGGTAEIAAYLAKRALFEGKPYEINHPNVFEAKILTAPTHIASLPLCLNINCHSARHIKALIKNDKITYSDIEYQISDKDLGGNLKELTSFDTDAINSLKEGEKILLSGTVYTARDAAHKKIYDLIKENKPLPFDIEDSIIFYAGPCPANKNEIIGPIGPTTSKRMDGFAPLLYKKGMLASIGKGDRTINGLNKIYFKATGGVASLLQQCIKKCELTAFPELESEAVYKLEIEKMPLTVCRI